MKHSRRAFFRKMGKAAGVTAAIVAIPEVVFAPAKAKMPDQLGDSRKGGYPMEIYVSAVVMEPTPPGDFWGDGGDDDLMPMRFQVQTVRGEKVFIDDKGIHPYIRRKP